MGQVHILCKSCCATRSLTNYFRLAVNSILNTSDEQFMYSCRHANNKLILSAVIVISIRLASSASASSPSEATYRILSLTNLNSDSSCLSRRSISSYSPHVSWKDVHGFWLLCLPTWISLRSAITRRAWVKAFSSVGGGVKGAPTKLEGGVIWWHEMAEVERSPQNNTA